MNRFTLHGSPHSLPTYKVAVKFANASGGAIPGIGRLF
jgi:hypothetical protein